MQQVTLTLVSLVFAFALGDVHVAWNASLTVSNDDLSGRTTVLTALQGGVIYSGLSYYSLQYEVGNATAHGDGVFGAAYTTFGGPLTTYLTYFDVSASWGGSANPAAADVSGAANLIGAAYLALVEVDENGATLGGLRLKSLTWSLSAVQTDGPLKHATFTGTTSLAGLTVTAAFAASDETGTLTNGAIVTPKSLQTTINILNYPFKSTTSKLRLIVGVGTASGSASGTVQKSGNWSRLRAGLDKTAVYFDGATHAYVDGNGTTKEVTFVSTGSGSVDADFDNAGFLTQLASIKGQKKLTVDYRLINITFEQSDNITYDPSIGVSQTPNTGTNAGATLQVQTPLVALAAIFAFAFAKAL